MATTFQINPASFTGLSGTVAIITGGSSGIGLATSQLFAQHGAHVVIADLKPPKDAVPNSVFSECDVTQWGTILATFEVAVKAFGRIDILIANAGVSELVDMFQDELDEGGLLKEPRYPALEINLRGVLHCVKIAVHYFKKQGTGGRIVMTASTAGYMGEPGVPVYSASKHGVVGYMRAMKKELQRQNIAINCVAPWMTDTPLIYPPLRKILAANNIPVQPASAVALAMAFSVTVPNWIGKTVYAAMSQYTELEEPILKLEEQWLGIENSKLFRIGQELDYLTATGESSAF